MNPEQWLSLKWNGGSTMSDRWLNQSKIIQSFIFYKRGYDGAIKISDCRMQYRNGIFDAVKDV